MTLALSEPKFNIFVPTQAIVLKSHWLWVALYKQ